MPFSHQRLLFIPLDARPVCLDMPKRLAASAGLKLLAPEAAMLGRLKQPADFTLLSSWLNTHCTDQLPLIASLDTVAYGGLIASRVNEEPYETLSGRVSRFFDALQGGDCFGFSAILRIPNYDFDEEEPAYWRQWGRKLYAYSEAKHRLGADDNTSIPAAVLEDFLARRCKNHTLNKSFLDDLAAGQLRYLTYCQDDTGTYGLNVEEARELETLISGRGLTAQAHVQTGADEVALCMLARWMSAQQPEPVKVWIAYSAAAGRKTIARFDGLPIEAVVEKSLAACGGCIASSAEEADCMLLVHVPTGHQGDHCEQAAADVSPEQAEAVIQTLREAFSNKMPVALADVAYANGSDPLLSKRLLAEFEDLTGLYGYGGWNTPGNAIGTTIAMAIVRMLAERNTCFNPSAFNRLLLLRLADDALYQAEVRRVVRSELNGGPPDASRLNTLMADGLALLKSRLGLENLPTECHYPCNRTFEVEIALG